MQLSFYKDEKNQMNAGNIQRYSEVDVLSVEGRMGRKLYFFYSVVVPFMFFWIFASIAGVIAKLGSVANVLSYALLGLALLIVAFMVIRLTVQRCHDFNKSGWLAALAFIPFSNLIFAMIPGDSGLNSYGEPPEPTSVFMTAAVVVLVSLMVALATFTLLYFFKII